MTDFRQHFYQFRNIDDHIEHLAQLEARGLTRDFIEGYGPVEELGIRTKVIDTDIRIEP